MRWTLAAVLACLLGIGLIVLAGRVRRMPPRPLDRIGPERDEGTGSPPPRRSD